MSTGKIKRDGASFRTEHVLSFRSQRDFVDSYLEKINFIRNPKEKKEFLISIYREAKKSIGDTPKTPPAEMNPAPVLPDQASFVPKEEIATANTTDTTE